MIRPYSKEPRFRSRCRHIPRPNICPESKADVTRKIGISAGLFPPPGRSLRRPSGCTFPNLNRYRYLRAFRSPLAQGSRRPQILWWRHGHYTPAPARSQRNCGRCPPGGSMSVVARASWAGRVRGVRFSPCGYQRGEGGRPGTAFRKFRDHRQQIAALGRPAPNEIGRASCRERV